MWTTESKDKEEKNVPKDSVVLINLTMKHCSAFDIDFGIVLTYYTNATPCYCCLIKMYEGTI